MAAPLIGALLKIAPMVMGMIGDKKNKKSEGSGDGLKAGGGMVSAAAPAVIGAVQSIQGMIKRKKADNLQPQLEDPEVRMQLNRIQSQAQALRAGTTSSRLGQQLQQVGTQSRLNALKIGGIAGLSAASRAGASVAQALVDLNAKNQAAAMEMDKLATQQIDKIAGRKLGLQRARHAQKLLEAETLKKAGSQNMMAALAATGKKAETPDDSNLGQTAGAEGTNADDLGSTQGTAE